MNPLEREIIKEITCRGPISFARFMELALYHPTLGYYRRTRDPFGSAGDYFTSSQLQPVFGRLIAQQVAAWRQELGRPSDFTVVDLGAGRGETAAELRRVLPGAPVIEVDRDRGELPRRFTGVVFANEFFDALPVHVLCFREGRWLERCVGVGAGGRLAWVEAAPSIQPPEQMPACDGITEVCPSALWWLDLVAQSLARGYLVILDYGYTSSEAARFPQGSLMSYRRHVASEDVLADPGERDITAHVNWTALAGCAESLGFRVQPLRSQAQFLVSIGAADEFRSALAASSEKEAQHYRMLLKTLLFGMGETFQVLVCERH